MRIWSGDGFDVLRARRLMTQGFEGLNCLVVVHVPTVPHVAVVRHSAALLLLVVFVALQVNIRALFHHECPPSQRGLL